MAWGSVFSICGVVFRVLMEGQLGVMVSVLLAWCFIFCFLGRAAWGSVFSVRSSSVPCFVLFVVRVMGG